MSVPEGEEIVVTGTRFRRYEEEDGGASETWSQMFWSVFVREYDPFQQYGGNETPELAQFEMIDGDVYVRLPGYDFRLKLPAADWARMGDRERGEFIKMMNEFREAPGLVQSFDRAQADGLTHIEVRYDSLIHRADGSTREWGNLQYGHASILTTNYETKIVAVVININ